MSDKVLYSASNVRYKMSNDDDDDDDDYDDDSCFVIHLSVSVCIYR